VSALPIYGTNEQKTVGPSRVARRRTRPRRSGAPTGTRGLPLRRRRAHQIHIRNVGERFRTIVTHPRTVAAPSGADYRASSSCSGPAHRALDLCGLRDRARRTSPAAPGAGACLLGPLNSFEEGVNPTALLAFGADPPPHRDVPTLCLAEPGHPDGMSSALEFLADPLVPGSFPRSHGSPRARQRRSSVPGIPISRCSYTAMTTFATS
jgi:hypothetical protein